MSLSGDDAIIENAMCGARSRFLRDIDPGRHGSFPSPQRTRAVPDFLHGTLTSFHDMLTTALSCIVLIALTTLIHYEALSGLNARLPGLGIPVRTRLLVVIFVAFVAHALEMALYGLALFLLLTWAGVGSLVGPGGSSLANCLYFSAETYSSLGFGDLIPTGPVRLLAGAEALNGLLLIGWSASYAYIAMERFWTDDNPG